jgi:transcriptional regulator with XRE-family HTH domain
MDNSLTTGQQIRRMRALRGMSLDDLAAKTGIHMTWISRIETGRANATEAQLAAIRAALQMPSDEAMAAAFALLAGEQEG